MSIPRKQIGWSQESNLLWGIWNDVDRISKAVNCCSNSEVNPTNVVLPAVASDAFGRQRVSQPFTLFDSSQRYGNNDLWAVATTVGGTAVFNADEGSVNMSVTTTSGSSCSKETYKVFSYQPGKSLLVLNTFVMDAPKTGLTQRVGYFGVDNGYYLEQADNVIAFVERSSVSGSIVETPVTQSNWNYDKMDGTGPSKITLDLTKAQILWIDMEWLGVGSVRMGFVINGQFYICHVFQHANIIASTYITTASLPLRYEIFNTGTTDSVSTLKQICSSVISEGGYELRGAQYSVSIPITTPRTFAVAGTYYPIIGVKLKTTALDAVVILTALSVLGLGNGKNYGWRVVQRGVITGGAWVPAAVNSSVEYNISGTSSTGGTIVASGFVNSSNQGSPVVNILKGALFNNQLERNGFTGTPFELILEATVSTTSGGEGMLASLDWEEISR